MTNILDNEKVKEFFGCDCGLTNDGSYVVVAHMRACSSMKVVTALQEPIKTGDRFLAVDRDWTIHESIAMEGYGALWCNPTRRLALRLPDRFQKKECIVCDGVVGKDAHLCDEHGRIWLGRKPAPEPCELKRCDGSCSPDKRCNVCRNKQSHCSCYKFTPDPEKCGECAEHSSCPHECVNEPRQPASAVEEKTKARWECHCTVKCKTLIDHIIDSLVAHEGWDHFKCQDRGQLENDLRALVKLAREGK